MGLLGKLSALVGPSADVAQVAEQHGFEVDTNCVPEDCSSCGKFPSSVKVEDDGKPMYGNTDEWDLHLLVATGQADWIRDITDVSGSIAKALDSNHSTIKNALPDKYTKHGSKIKISNTSMPVNDDGTAKILILPIFKVVTATAANAVEKVCAALIGDSSDPDIQDDSAKGYILLCSHKTRDKRCGITAPIMKKQFDIELRQHDLYRDATGDDRPGGVQVLYVNHVGGHKFVANVFIYTKDSAIWMARANPTHVKGIVDQSILSGKVVFTPLLRQCVKW